MIFWEFLTIGWKREFRSPFKLIGSAIFLCVILFVFSNLWREAFASGFSSFSAPADYVWYLFLTELIVLSTPLAFRTIQDDVRSGDIAQRLLKPVSYWVFPIGEHFGTALARITVLIPLGGAFCFLTTGGFPGELRGLTIGLFLVPISCLLLIVFMSSIGLLSLWIYDSQPFYWVFQKFMFIFGGLMIPVSVYPEWLQKISFATPYPAMLYRVGNNVFEFSWEAAMVSLTLLLFWLLVAFALLLLVYRLVTRALVIGGG